MRYYTCANTSSGFCDFTMDNLFDVGKTVEIKSTNHYITDRVLRQLCNSLSEPLNWIIAHGTENLLCGIVTDSRSFAVISGEGSSSDTIDVDLMLKIPEHPKRTMPSAMEKAYKTAKDIHDDWEKIYIENMNFNKLDLYCRNIILSLVKSESTYGSGKVYKRFFGTTTPKGTVNYIDEITKGLKERYFIKGRPGTGKSTFLKRLSAKLIEKGFDIEQYYCSFDPMSLDMVISRELSFCVFDSTTPHEKFPEDQRDVILDFYEESELSGVDERYEKELTLIRNAYNAKIKEGNEALKDAMISDNALKLCESEKVGKNEIEDVVKRICQYIGR